MGSVLTRSVRYLGLAALTALPPAAFALFNIDGTRNQIFVFGRASLGYDSNVFAENIARSDYTTTATVGAELKRRAGIISVDARGTVDYLHFDRFDELSGWNPNFLLEFNKTTGRTTGSLALNSYRASKADSAVNLRTESWNTPVTLKLKYPVNEKFYVTSQTGYLRRTFAELETLADYSDFNQAFDLFYVYTSKLDLLAGYRIRAAETDVQGRTTDHDFNIGATGGLLAKVNGTVRAGYQFREIHRTGDTFDHFTMSASLTWNATRKFSATSQVVRDFNTTATGTSVASTSVVFGSTYVFTRRLQAAASLGFGRNDFVGESQSNRRDDFISGDLGVSYTWGDRLKISGNYTALQNSSTAGFADFDRHTYTVEIGSRW